MEDLGFEGKVEMIVVEHGGCWLYGPLCTLAPRVLV